MKSSHGTQRSRRDSGVVDRRGLIRGGIVGLVGLVFGFLGVQRTEANSRDGRVAIPRLNINLPNFNTEEGHFDSQVAIARAVRLRPGETVLYWVSSVEDRVGNEFFGYRYWRVARITCSPSGVRICRFEETMQFSPGMPDAA